MTLINKAEALRLLKLAVDERGEDYVYPNQNLVSCQYVDPETLEPKCLVGLALVKAGVDPSLFLPCNSMAIDRLLVHNYHEFGGFTFTDAARQVLSSAQTVQDQNGTWGAAYERALDAPLTD